jgi:hypothetical protein
MLRRIVTEGSGVETVVISVIVKTEPSEKSKIPVENVGEVSGPV